MSVVGGSRKRLRTTEMLEEELKELREEVQRLEARVRSLRTIKFTLEDQLDLLQCLVEEYEQDVDYLFGDEEENKEAEENTSGDENPQ